MFEEGEGERCLESIEIHLTRGGGLFDSQDWPRRRGKIKGAGGERERLRVGGTSERMKRAINYAEKLRSMEERAPVKY